MRSIPHERSSKDAEKSRKACHERQFAKEKAATKEIHREGRPRMICMRGWRETPLLCHHRAIIVQSCCLASDSGRIRSSPPKDECNVFMKMISGSCSGFDIHNLFSRERKPSFQFVVNIVHVDQSGHVFRERLQTKLQYHC